MVDYFDLRVAEVDWEGILYGWLVGESTLGAVRLLPSKVFRNKLVLPVDS